ncbi:MAG TPA: hypothetical protein VK211_07810 [Kamptonema sp.]|nr:hypothetical protein [Kamptonema sp.]
MPEADLSANQHPRSFAIKSDARLVQPAEASIPEGVADNSGESEDSQKGIPAATLSAFLSETEDDWETVNFPNAISVDAIPTKSVEDGGIEAEIEELSTRVIPTANPNPSISPVSVRDRAYTIQFSEQPKNKTGAPATLIQALHECNRDLVQRIKELEAALVDSQNALVAKETLLEAKNAELSDAQQQVTRLFGKQEQVNQIIQRQEVLIETLTAQLQTNQTRVAVIERECALTQQRYSEQQHLLAQTENACRELRSRLHRQQRHTLQFKAALERYLEMPHLKSEVKTYISESRDESISFQSEAIITPPQIQSAEVQLNSQASPVKPWSEQQNPISGGQVSEEVTPALSQENSDRKICAELTNNQLQDVETYWHIEGTENPFLSAELEEDNDDADNLNVNEVEAVRELSFLDTTKTPVPEAPQRIAEPIFVGKSDWVASITYAPSPVKKRRSLAEIELPSFR